jgi:dCTP deaminase
MNEPWKDWIPGVLSKEQVQDLCKEECIKSVKGWDSKKKSGNPIDHSSIDLTLSKEAYEMANGSIKPTEQDVYKRTILENRGYAKVHNDVDGDGIFLLEKKHTYVFVLNEKLDGLKLKDSPIYGRATAKSSVGRVDVLARLIVDKMGHYEYFDPQKLPSQEVEMFLEVTPITFNVRVKVGESLSQLRLFYYRPDNSRMQGKELCRCLLRREKSVEDETLSVDLSGTKIFKKDKSVYKDNIVAFKRKVEQNIPIDLWKNDEKDKPDPNDYWECIEASRNKRLLVEKDHFYILRSKERLCLPEGIAVYCRAIDEAIGEMRIHYAGFAHPFFGKDRKDQKEGTPLIFEVRGHNINVNLVDDERLARLAFYRMSKDCKKPEDYEEGEEEDDYNEQELRLSKFFRPWGS